MNEMLPSTREHSPVLHSQGKDGLAKGVRNISSSGARILCIHLCPGNHFAFGITIQTGPARVPLKSFFWCIPKASNFPFWGDLMII